MWERRRRIAALVQALLFLSLPFFRVGGESAFRFDIPTLTLHLFGAAVPIEEFHLVLAAVLFLLLVTVAVALAFGRLWCGWACPQTVLPAIAGWAAEALPGPLRRIGARLLLVLLSGAVAFSIAAWFIPPAGLIRALPESGIVRGAVLVLWAFLFGMAGLAGTRFCRTVCPYAMLQNAVGDGETLSVSFDAARADACLRCARCAAACPVALDVRKGPDRACLACAACMDACAGAVSGAGLAPFVAYRGRIARGKTLAVAGASAAALALLAVLVAARPGVDFSVQWTGSDPATGANRYRYVVRNDLDREVELRLRVEGGFTLAGAPELRVGPRGRSTGTVRLTRDGREGLKRPEFVLSGNGIALRREAGYL